MKYTLLLTMLSSFVFAQSTRQTMGKSLDAVIKLIPYTSYELKYIDPKNKENINLYLETLLKAFKDGKHNKEFKQVGFGPSYATLKEHLQETIDSFNSSHKDFSFAQARNITPLCLSCHNQLPKDYNSSFSLGIKQIKRKDFETEFEYAEFLYLVRDYTQAERQYLKVIKNKLEKQKALKKEKSSIAFNDPSLTQSLRKLLEINVRIKRDFKKAQRQLKKVLRNKYLPNSNRVVVLAWLEDIKQWRKNFPKGINIKTDSAMKAFVKKYLYPLKKEGITLTEDSDVDMLITAGVLSNYLFRHSNKENTPQILLWMGMAENVLGKNVFYTLGDNYFKNCIKKYSNSAYASECYKEYEESIKFRYTGSAGTSIPDNMKRSLNKLKKLVR